jgi:hypothetical protein
MGQSLQHLSLIMGLQAFSAKFVFAAQFRSTVLEVWYVKILQVLNNKSETSACNGL